MKKIIFYLLAVAMLIQPATVWGEEAQNSIIDTQMAEILANSVIWIDGGTDVLDHGSLVSMVSGDEYLKSEMLGEDFFIPAEYAKKLLNVEKVSGKRFSAENIEGSIKYLYDGVLICPDKELDESKIKLNINNIIKLFGVYVDTNVEKSGNGTINKPVKTLEEARKCVYNIKTTIGLPKGSFPVYFREGKYLINETVNFDQNDSGLDNSKIYYKSYPGEKAHFEGGISISGKEFKPVTDKLMLQRIDESARGKIYYANLNEYGLKQYGESVTRTDVNPMNNEMFYNNEVMTISRWPNDERTKTGKILIANGSWTNPGFKFEFNNSRIKRWDTADNAWVSGTFAWEWNEQAHKVSEISVADKTILTAENHRYVPTEGKEWYIYNLIEELDEPQEYYFDRQTGYLYFYPYVSEVENGKFLESNIQFSVFDQLMVKMYGCKNIIFEDMVFENSGSGGIFLMDSTDGIQILGCTIRNISGRCIDIVNGYNNLVHGCDMYNVDTCVYITGGGDRETLAPGNNEVSNCRCYNFSRIIRTNNAGLYIKNGSVGNRIINNEIFNFPHHAVNFHACNDNVIAYNEIYDGLTDGAGDAGLIHPGVDPSLFGNRIENNYFHDTNVGMGCVYIDDGGGGIYIQNNIFYNVNRSVFLHGAQYNTVSNNITINSNIAGIAISHLSHDTRWNPDTLTEIEGASDKSYFYMQNLKAVPDFRNALWKERYPELQELVARGVAYYPHGTKAYNNVEISPNNVAAVNINSTCADTVENYNNYSTTDDIGFVDMENNNFNLKEDAEIFNIIPGFEKIDFDKIGIYADDVRKEMPVINSFDMMYPYNRVTDVDARSVKFSWSDCQTTRKYRFRLALDKDFTEIVRDIEVLGTSVTVTNLRYNQTGYYWKVEAISNNQKALEEKSRKSDSEYFSFVTMKNELIDMTDVNETTQRMEEFYESMTEGEEPGDFHEGAKEEYRNLLEEFREGFAGGVLTQRKVNKFVEQAKLREDIILTKRNMKILSIDEMLVQEDWTFIQNNINFTKNSFKQIANGETCGGYSLRKLDAHEGIQFEAIFDVDGGAWQGISMRASSPDSPSWSGNSQYMVIVKEDVLEFQKYGETSIYETYPNECIKSGEEYLVEFSLQNLEDGSVRALFKVNDEVIIDYTDSEKPITTKGYMQFYNPVSGRTLIIKGVNE